MKSMDPPRSCSSSRNVFEPRDDELLQLFLYNKVHGKPLPGNAAATILEYDLYGQKNPWEIWEQFTAGDCKTDLYFFTTLKNNNNSASARQRSVRAIGLGSWEGEDAGKIIVAPDDRHKKHPLGMKRSFRFDKSGTDQDGRWIMHEYSLHSSLYPCGLQKGIDHHLVLCRVSKNFLGHNNSRKRTRTAATTTTCGRQPEKKRRKMIVLALAAPTELIVTDNDNSNNVSVGKDICQEPKTHPESGVKTGNSSTRDDVEPAESGVKTEYSSTRDEVEPAESGVKTEYNSTDSTGNEIKLEEEDEDVPMSWSQLFALQLTTGCWVQQEQYQMLPNTFYKDLLLENFDVQFINSCN